MKRTMRRTFRYVVSWNEHSWSISTTDFDFVSRGDTIEGAIENMEKTLRYNALMDQTLGRKAFGIGERTPHEASRSLDRSVPVAYSNGAPSRDRRYWGELTVEWDVTRSWRRRSNKRLGHGDREWVDDRLSGTQPAQREGVRGKDQAYVGTTLERTSAFFEYGIDVCVSLCHSQVRCR